MASDQRSTVEERRRALEGILAGAPDARVGAVSAQGRFVELPEELGITGHPPVEATSPTELVQATDLAKVIESWEASARTGISTGTFHLADGSVNRIHIVNLTEAVGVYVIVFEETGDGEAATGVSGPRSQSLGQRVSRMRKNAVAAITEVDDAATEMFGWARDELVGKRPADFIHPDDFDRSVDAWMRLLQAPGSMYTVRVRHSCKDGRWLWVDILNHNLLDSEGDVPSEIIDVSDQVAAEEALREQEEFLRRLTESLPSGVLTLDRDGRVAYASDRMYELFDVPRSGRASDLLAPVVHGAEALVEATTEALRSGRDSDLEVSAHAPDGSLRVCGVTIRALQDDDGSPNGVVLSATDISDTVARRAELEARATYDELTGCHNRASTSAALEHALASDPDTGTAVVFVDVDGLKPVNDRLGHATGDALLRLVADRLRATVRAQDLVGRYGGDEFVVVCPEIAQPAKAAEVAARIGDALGAEAEVAGTTLTPSASLGLAWSRNGETSAQDLVDQADAAMYEVKRARRAAARAYGTGSPEAARDHTGAGASTASR